MPRAMRVGTASFAVLIMAAACTSPAGSPETAGPAATATEIPAAATPTPVPLAAFVSGEAITLEAFDREVARFEAANAELGIDLATLGDYRSAVLSELIDLSLLAQFAASRDMGLSEAELDQRFEAAVEARGGPQQMATWMEASFYTEEQFRTELRQEVLAARTIGAITEVLPVEVEHTHARHLLVATREEAETLLSEIAEGADLGTLASIHSLDPSTRLAGGDLGWFPQGLLTMLEVDQLAFSLEPGEISGVIETELGFHILEVLEREDRPLIGESLALYRVAAVEDWLADQRGRVEIEIFVETD